MHEFEVIQNPVIGSIALHVFAKSYVAEHTERLGPPIVFAFPVIAIIYHEQSVIRLMQVKRITQMRFLNTLAEYRDLPAGLQQRMVAMSDQTLETLNVAFALKLLSYNTETATISHRRLSKNIPRFTYGDNQEIMHAAKVLGCWFAGYSIEEICSLLNITF